MTAAIPGRYDFTGGETGRSIADGGADMYDGGNYLSTGLGGYLEYSDGAVRTSPLLGLTGRYFTRKYPGLFVLAADLDAVTELLVTGDLGANGAGAADGATLDVVRGDRTYRAFVKRVFGAGDPSVNHMWIVPEPGAATHAFSGNTNSDQHQLRGVSTGRVYYLLYAAAAGAYLDDAATRGILEAFLDAGAAGPARLALSPASGVVPAGGSAALRVTFRSAGLLGGAYDTPVIVESNDPDAPATRVPTRLDVIGVPDIALSPDTLDLDTVFVGMSRADSVRVRNTGSDWLHVAGLRAEGAGFGVDPGSFALAPGAERAVAVRFAPAAAGIAEGALVVDNDDPDEPEARAVLRGVGLVPPDVAVVPAAISVSLYTGETATRELTVVNAGGSDLVWTLDIYDVAGGGLEPAESETLGAVSLGLAASDTGTVERQGLRVRYGPAADRTVLLYSDDPFRTPGGHYPDAALRRLGQPYTAVYYDATAFGAALASRPWDLVVVAHETSPTLGQWWEELRQYREGGGRLLISTFDVDGSRSEPTGLWNVIGLQLWADLTTARPVSWWFPTHPLFLYPQAVPELSSPLSSYADNGDRVKPLEPAAAPAGFLTTPAAGQAAIVVAADGRAIVNSFVPTEFGADADGDGTLDAIELLANEIHHLLGWTGWVSAEPAGGVVPAGESRSVGLTFDAAGLGSGDRRAELLVASNDPDQPRATVPLHMHIVGVQDIAVTPDSLDFGVRLVGARVAAEVVVRNLGTEPLIVSGVTIAPAAFVVEQVPFALAPGGARSLYVIFAPTEVGEWTGALTLRSDDPDEPEVSVGLHGAAEPAPQSDVTPGSLFVQMPAGQIALRTLTLHNSGAGPLVWSAHTQLAVPFGAAGDSAAAGGAPPDSAATAPDTAAAPGPGPAAVPARWVVFRDDMEDGVNGWTTVASEGPDLWHQTTRVSGSPNHSWWYGDEAKGNYDVARPIQVFLVSPQIDLRTAVAPVTLQFWERLVTEAQYDECTVYVSANRVNWYQVRSSQSGNLGERIVTTDLSDYAGRGIYLGFRFRVWNEGNDFPGWFIDDVQVTGTSPAWLAVTPNAGEVAPGASVELQVMFDSRDQGPGLLEGEVVIATNDPDDSPLIVPVQLYVPGLPDIDLSTTALDFGTVLVGQSATRSLWVQNVGNDELVVSEVSVSDPAFRVTPTSLTLRPWASGKAEIEFTPAAAGEVVAALVVRSNDPDEPELTVSLRAAGVVAPDIGVAPESLVVDVRPGELRTETLTLSNTGVLALQWSAHTRLTVPLTAPAAPGTPALELLGGAPQPRTVLFFDNMENGLNGWTTVAYGGDDLWHQTERAATSATHSWWCGVEPQGDYNTGRAVVCAAVSPAIDLRAVTDPVTLEFLEKLDTEFGWDRCDVDVSRDGGATWLPWRGPASGNSEGWRAVSLDLSFFTGYVVKVRFYFHTSDANANDLSGWFFDDVMVSTGMPGWVTVSPRMGTLIEGESLDLAVTFDASRLPAGAYRSEILFSSNDPDENPLVVPLHTNVSAAGTVAVEAAPERFDLAPVAPNPAHGVARIDFALPRAGTVRAAVYDVTGRRVRTLCTGPWGAGRWRLVWSGEGDGGVRQGAGVYLVRLEGPDGTRTRRFVWLP